jgi:predicted amino acid dehydrogenase
VKLCVRQVVEQSSALGQLVDQKQVAIVGALLDVGTGVVEFFESELLV